MILRRELYGSRQESKERLQCYELRLLTYRRANQARAQAKANGESSKNLGLLLRGDNFNNVHSRLALLHLKSPSTVDELNNIK